MGNEWFLGTGKGREKAIKSGMSGETAVRAKMCLLGLVLELYFFLEIRHLPLDHQCVHSPKTE